MVKIEAVVGPSRLEKIQEVLKHDWVAGITVTEVKGPRGPRTERYRGVERPAPLSPLLRVEVVIPTPLLPRMLHDLEQALRSGSAAEDLLSVLPVDEAIQVRTGERGEGAL